MKKIGAEKCAVQFRAPFRCTKVIYVFNLPPLIELQSIIDHRRSDTMIAADTHRA